MSQGDKLFDGWSLGGFWGALYYALSVVACTVIARAAVSWVRAIKPRRAGDPLTFRDRWQRHFCSSRTFDLDPSIIGTFELMAYPILMKLQAWTIIGAWLGFKTVGQWEAWKEERAQYNQFLIGNAVVLLLSFLIGYFLVRVQPVPCEWLPG